MTRHPRKTDWYDRSLAIGAVAFTLIVLTGLVGYIIGIEHDHQKNVVTDLRMQELAGTIRHLDEVLTMSASMAAATGDLSWEERYHRQNELLAAAIQEAAGMIPPPAAAEFTARTEVANQKLVAMNRRSFELVRAGRREEALRLLQSPEYQHQKEIYAEGLGMLIQAMEQKIAAASHIHRTRTQLAGWVTTLAGLLLSLVWLRVWRSLGRHLAARTEMEGRLRESESLFRELAEKHDHGIYVLVIDPSRVTYVNPAVERIWGRSASAFYAHPTLWLEAIHPEDQERAVSVAEEVRKGNGSPGSVTYRVIRPDGTIRWVHDRIIMLPGENGRPARLTGIAQDITERKEAEAAIITLNLKLRRYAAELEAALAESEEFAYAAAHNLRTPLRGIEGFCQVLLEDQGAQLGPEGQANLARVQEAARRMAGLIDDLLRLSRLGRITVHRRPTDLSALARSVAERLQSREPARRVEFVIPDGLTADCDAALLRMALEELLGNAWKFTNKTAAARIEVGSTPQPDGTTAFFVRDNGIGFDMGYASKLFVPFQRLHRADDFPGTGVGLTVVKRIVSRHGGRVWAVGGEGQGATFYFTL